MGEVNTGYVSDHTRWIDEQLAKHPEWVEDQKVGRALWWDKKQEVDTSERYAAANGGAEALSLRRPLLRRRQVAVALRFVP